MSIPERLWRVARGHWALGQERLTDRISAAERELDEATGRTTSGSGLGSSAEERVSAKIDSKLAEAAAYREIAEILRNGPPAGAEHGTGNTASPGAGHDPMDACYTLLRIQPGSDLNSVDTAYNARMAELQPDRHPAGSSDRAHVEARRAAVEAAYQRLRDTLNPTETRFERLEF